MSCFSVAFPTKFHFIHVEQQSDNRPNIPYWLWIWGSLVISYRSIPCFYIICFTLDYAPKVDNRDTNSGCMSYRYSRATEIFFFPHFLFSRPDHTGYFISQFRVRFARVSCSLSCEIGEDTLMQKNNNSKKKIKNKLEG